MLPLFATVFSYETYRLHDKRTVLAPNENLELQRMKRKIEGLIATLKLFNGTNPIKLFRCLAVSRHGFRALGSVPEAAAVCSLYFLEGEANTIYESFAARGTLSATRIREFIGPHVLYLTDSELEKAHNRVTLILQKSTEDENAHADQIIAESHDCSDVFEDHTLFHYYVCGIHGTIRDKVIEDIHRLPEFKQRDLTLILRLSFEQGNTVRAPSQTTDKVRILFHRRTPTMYVSEEQQLEPYFRNPEFPHLLNHRAGMLSDFRVRDPETACNIAIGLESILFTGATSGSTTPTWMNSDAFPASFGVDLVTTPVHRESVPTPA